MKLSLYLVFAFIISGCTNLKLPKQRYGQYKYLHSFVYEEDKLKIELGNPLYCPLRIWMFHADSSMQAKFNEINPILLEAQTDTLLEFLQYVQANEEVRFTSRLGSTYKEVQDLKMQLPFPKNKEYTIIQGNDTDFTHSSDYSKYAIDFNLKTNDTICSATNGYVVGVIDQYQFGGKGVEWRPYSNYVTIYDPASGVFCQYAHLVKNGSLVNVGDKVIMGQPIALSGNTGQTTEPHLHFNCLIPVDSNDGLISVPVEFINGQKGMDLKKGAVVKR